MGWMAHLEPRQMHDQLLHVIVASKEEHNASDQVDELPVPLDLLRMVRVLAVLLFQVQHPSSDCY